jgi:uncharacterized RDD family membrane protein YckC
VIPEMSSDNPYASPMTQSSAPGVGVFGGDIPLNELVPGTSGQRLANYFVDNIGTRLFAWGCGIVLGFVLVFLGIEDLMDDVTGLKGVALGYLTTLIYYFVQETLFRRTIGKLFSKTIVVDENGGRPTLAQILGRSCVRLIPFESFSALSNLTPNPWHDRWTGTKVVQLPRGESSS